MFEYIFLDIDDVCNLFTMYALKELGCPVEPEDLNAYDPAWEFNIVKAANALHPNKCYDEQRLWNQLQGSEVWRNPPPSPEFKPLLNFCEAIVGRKNIYFLTCPVLDPQCLAGKLEWIQEHVPENMQRQYLIGPPKHLLAAPDRVLIDDKDENITDFRKAGGKAVLFPRPWNSGYAAYKEPLISVFQDISKILRNTNKLYGIPYWITT